MTQSTARKPTDTRTETAPDTINTILQTPVDTTNPPPSTGTAFALSHPKNYIGGTIAIAATGATGAVIPQHLTRLAGAVRRGTTALDLTRPDNTVTPRGTTIIKHANQVHGSPDACIESLGELHGDATRFITARPDWRGITQAVLATHPDMHAILNAVKAHGPATLRELVETLTDHDPATATIFTGQPLNRNDTVDLTSTDAYRSEITSHVKSMLWHAGLLTSTGATTDVHTPGTCLWELSPRMHDDVHAFITTEPPTHTTPTPASNGGEGQ